MYYHPIQQKINNSEPIIFIHGTGMDHTVWTLPVRYFSRKKIETEKVIYNLEIDLKKFSNQESLIILIAFILQLIIFISVQYFEVTMETANAKRTKKK